MKTCINMADNMPKFQYDPNRYDLKRGELIGAGGFGKVFKVKDKHSTGIYAMKVIQDFERDPPNECKVMAGLFHANILQLLQYGFEHGGLQLLFEYCPEGDLNAVLQQTSSQELNHRWMKQIVDGVAYLHLENVVHRDLKPGNVLLASSGDIKIADFGLSRFFPGKKQQENNEKKSSYLAPEIINTELYSTHISQSKRYMITRAGTRMYAAPEVFDERSHGYTKKADVFALGLLLYSIEERTFLMINGERFYGVFVHNNKPNGSYIPISKLMTDRGEDVAPTFRCANISLVNTILSCLRYDHGMKPHAADLKVELNNILAT